jgi:hypothetical protein
MVEGGVLSTVTSRSQTADPDNYQQPFGWWDVFNEVLYRKEADAEMARRGGNEIIPLYEKK